MSWRGLLSILFVAGVALNTSPGLAAVALEPDGWPTSIQSATPSDLTAARAAFERRDFPTAYRLLQPLAQGGAAPAQVGLGRLHALGLGIPRNDAEAIRWYRLAAEQGDPDGMSSLAYKYRFSDPPMRNSEQALVWYRWAAELDHPDALNGLGSIYLEGVLVPQDTAEAMALFERAIAKGHAPAMSNLADMLVGGAVERDHIRARELYRQAAEKYVIAAYYSYARMLFEGRGGPIDNDGALKFAGLAAAERSLPAYDMLATLYREGRGVPVDLAASARYTLIAAEAGLPGAQNDAGFNADQGLGVAQNFDVALRWYERAANQGHPNAMQRLANLYLNGRAVARNLPRAYAWLTLAARRYPQNAPQRVALLRQRNQLQMRMGPVQLERANAIIDSFMARAESNEAPNPQPVIEPRIDIRLTPRR